MALSSRRSGLWVGGVVALVVLSGLAWWAGAGSQSPSQAAARAQPPVASWVSVPVELRVLSSTLITRGDVGAESTLGVVAPSSVEGPPVVTSLAVVGGDVVAEGDRVVEVSGRPVFVLVGEVPVYRSLRPGMSGADVEQLQAALVRLGFRPEENGRFGSKTKRAVTALYEAAGYSPVPTSETFREDLAAARESLAAAEVGVADARAASGSSTSASSVASARAAVNDAQRALDAAIADRGPAVAVAEAELAAAERARDRARPGPQRVAARVVARQAGANVASVQRSTQDAIDSASDQLRVAQLSLGETTAGGGGAASGVDAAVTARDAARRALRSLQAQNGPTVAQGEVVFVSSMPARVLSAVTALGPVDVVAAGDGTGAGPGVLVSVASGSLVIRSQVPAGELGLVRVGMAVEVLDETTDTVYQASVVSIADEPTAGNDPTAGFAVTIAGDEALPDGLAGANVRVTITAAATDGEVLVVPLAAVSSAADGSTRVSVLSADGDPVDVAVNAGLSADGFVAVEPVEAGGLAAGDAVVVGR